MANTPKVWFGQRVHNFEHLESSAYLISVTASSGGFGRSLVELILKGGDIAVATLRTPSVLDDLKQAYDESNLLILPLDVVNAEQIRSAFQAATDKYGRIDFVYNLAGHGLIAEVEGTPEEEARTLFEVNFWGATRVSNEAVRVFREVNKPQGGHLFVISSLVSLNPMAGTGFYSASKHGQALSCQNRVPLAHQDYSIGRCNRGHEPGAPSVLGYQGMSPDFHLPIFYLTLRIDHDNRARVFQNQGHQGKPQSLGSPPSVFRCLPRIKTATGFSACDHHEQRPSEAVRGCVLSGRTRSEPPT